MRDTLHKIVVPIYSLAMELADNEKQAKLTRVLDLWDTNGYLPPDILKNMRVPDCEEFIQKWKEKQKQICEARIAAIETEHNERYESMRKQHEQFAEHVRKSIAAREEAAATGGGGGG
ncbi:unnamed protein product, partial [Dibothriocephalus latus]